MREILFRGKRVDNGRWVEGQYTCEEYEPHLQKVLHIDRIAIAGACVSVGVIPETVGQYTGLKDKNGKRIFEGDVIKDDKHLYLIEWYAGDFDAGFLPFICSENCRAVRSCNCEIIGDIHDNPELLEGGIT